MSNGAPSTPAVTVAVVTHDSAEELPGCLAAIGDLTWSPVRALVVDCASRDGSAERARRSAPDGLDLTVVELGKNRGFAGGMNEALHGGDDPWVLSLNPDARPAPDYLERLLEAVAAARAAGWRVGAVTGRLLRPAEPGEVARLDACGMVLSPAWRHFDRGSDLPDRGQYDRIERVFGATGAASLFSRAALQDVALEGEVFDADFHSYREDAELAFRLRERGWEIVYSPEARAEHRRHNLPARRRAMSREINRHSLKNRYLLRFYHQSGRNLIRTLLPATFRDLAALAWVLALERSSLGAYGWLWRNRRRIAARRRLLWSRRLAPSAEIDRWFFHPSLPLVPGPGVRGPDPRSRRVDTS